MIVSTKILADMVTKIINTDQSNVMALSLYIYSASSQFSIDKCMIEHFELIKKFGGNTTNDIQVKINLTPAQIAELIKNQTNLLASLIIEYVDSASGNIRFSDPPYTATFRVLIHNPDDLNKKYGATVYNDTNPLADKTKGTNRITESLLQLDLQLVRPEEYSMNKAHYHGMMTDTTIDKAIHFVASMMKVPKLDLIPPDNTAEYKHMIIPPEHGDFNKLFDYLQEQYGIYSKGLNYFMDDQTLFIYPAYETRLNRSSKLTILKVGVGAYGGATNYHKLEGSHLTIVSNSDTEQKTLSSVSAENNGNSQLFMKADTMIDGQIDHNTMTVKSTSVSASNKSDNSIQQTSAVVKYSQPTINLYSKVSKMASGEGETVKLSWPYCRLNLIEPGMPCVYVYDEKEMLVQKYGIVDDVKYTVSRTVKKGEEYIYSATAAISIRLEINHENYSG